MDPEAARRQLQKYMSTFRGRALLGPLPLPPATAGSPGAGVAQVRAAAHNGGMPKPLPCARHAAATGPSAGDGCFSADPAHLPAACCFCLQLYCPTHMSFEGKG